MVVKPYKKDRKLETYVCERWTKQREWIDLAARLQKFIDDQFSKFVNANGGNVPFEEIHLLYEDILPEYRSRFDDLFMQHGIRWTDYFHPNYFSGYLDLTNKFTGIPTYIDPEFGRRLYDLRGINAIRTFQGLILSDIDFSYLNQESFDAQFCGFGHSKLYGCRFCFCDLNNSALGYHNRGCKFIKTNFHRGWLSDHCFEKCYFEQCRFTRLRSFCSILKDCHFINCNFQNTYFGYTVVERCTFVDCDFKCAWMNYGIYRDSSFIGCRFEGMKEGFIPPGIKEDPKDVS